MVGNFNFNTIYIIESLFDQDEKTGKILFNDTIKRNSERTGLFHTKFLAIANKAAFIECLKTINNYSIKGYYPFIHFEIHGSENKDGLILKSGELITWNELANETRQINITTKNNLVISLSTCYGAYFSTEIEILKAAPFCGCVCATSKIPEYEIIPRFTIFFETFYDSRDFDLSIIKLNEVNDFEHRFKFMTCAEIFEELLVQMENDEYHVDSIFLKNLVNLFTEKFKQLEASKFPKEQNLSVVRNELISRISSIKDELRKSFLMQDIS